MKEPTRLRKRLCLEIAEYLEADLRGRSYDVDRAARIIEIHLPLTRDEAIADIEEFDEEDAPRRKTSNLPNLGERLRKALGVGPEVDLFAAITGAVERLEAIQQGKVAAS